MKIIFMGTPSFAIPSLEKIYNSRHEIAAVVTAPDKPVGRGLHIQESDVKKASRKYNLTVLQPEKLNDFKFIEAVKDINPDLIVVVAFRILPKEVFTLPRFGSVNLHASLLPKFRGAAPINWAIIKGEEETGVTTFFLKEKVDSGNIILQNSCRIYPEDNAGTLHDRLAELGSSTLLNTIELIEMTNGNVQVSEQDQSKVSKAPKITPELCHINWKMNSTDIHNLVRGLSPYPAAFSILRNKRIKIFKTKIADIFFEEKIPGMLKVIGNKLYVKTLDSSVQILEIQLEGKKMMQTSEFLKGYNFYPTDILI